MHIGSDRYPNDSRIIAITFIGLAIAAVASVILILLSVL